MLTIYECMLESVLMGGDLWLAFSYVNWVRALPTDPTACVYYLYPVENHQADFISFNNPPPQSPHS